MPILFLSATRAKYKWRLPFCHVATRETGNKLAEFVEISAFEGSTMSHAFPCFATSPECTEVPIAVGSHSSGCHEQLGTVGRRSGPQQLGTSTNSVFTYRLLNRDTNHNVAG